MASSRKADFNLNSIGKAATDSRYINYKALQYAIIYGKKPNLRFLQDREIAEKRIAELDKIYARGEKPPLAQKFSSPTKKARKNKEQYDTQNVKVENIKTGEVLEFENINQLSKYLGEKCGNELRSDKIKEKIEYKKIYKKEWRFSYIEEGD